jgi:hypothetical protein
LEYDKDLRKARYFYSNKRKSQFKKRLTPRDLIKQLDVYKRPLEGPAGKPSINGKHHFVTIKITHGWLSIEKMKDVGTSPWESVTRDTYEGKPRLEPVVLLATDTGKQNRTVGDLVEYVCADELNKPYNLVSDNCQTLVKRRC